MKPDENTSNIFFNLLIGVMSVLSILNFRQAIRDKKTIARLLQENEQLKAELLCLKPL